MSEEIVSQFRNSPPPEISASDPNFVKHVTCEGARWHVLHFDSEGTHCSEPKCIINKRKAIGKEAANVLQPEYGPRDWKTDHSHENGDYLNECCICHQQFLGHKRRPICKVCGTETVFVQVAWPSREMLMAALKWLRRIEERRDDLPASFFDGADVTEVRKCFEGLLEIKDGHAAAEPQSGVNDENR